MRTRASRTLADIGEFDLIDRIEAMVAREGGAARSLSRHVRVGIGDDAAVLALRSGEELVVSSDAFVEAVHFRFETRAAASIGRCALAASLSDLAAMGARPLGFTCALAAPPTLALTRFDGVIRGLIAGSLAWQTPLVGGNLTQGAETSLALTVFGAVPAGRALLRSELRPGDRLFVTGTLGGAALALARSRTGVKLRHVPEPRLAAGRALARMRERGACIDLSDGFIADLRHLLDSSGRGPARDQARAGSVGVEIDIEKLPQPRGFATACARAAVDAERLVLEGGEDYELLFSLRARGPGASVLSHRMGVMVTEIGRAVRSAGIHGVGRPHQRGGWRHF